MLKKLTSILLALAFLVPASADATIGLKPSYPVGSFLIGNGTSLINSTSTPHFGAFSFTSATGTAATTTSLFSTSIFSTTFNNSGLASLVNLLTTGSSTLQAFTFTNATGSQATTSSFAITSLVSKMLKTNASGSVIAAVAGTDYQAPISLTTTGTSGAATFDGTTLNIPNYTTSGGGSGNVATSSSETSGRVPFWTSTGATPATLSGGVAGFAFDSSLNKLTVTNGQFTDATTTNATTTNLYVSGTASTSALRLASGSGLLISTNGLVSAIAGTTCTNQFLRAFTVSGGTCATVANTDLANSTISGIALGANLADLTATNGTLTFSGAYNGGTARTIGLNLANANTWTGGQIFANSTTTNATTTNLYVSGTASTTQMNANTSTIGALTVGSCTGCSGASASTTVKYYTANGTWTKPANLKWVEIYVAGGGGGAFGASAGNGGNSSFGSHCTANGGGKGNSGGGSSRPSGGTASGGDMNITGPSGSLAVFRDSNGGSTINLGTNGPSAPWFGGEIGRGGHVPQDSGGATGTSGAAGGFCYELIPAAALGATETITIGAGGAAASVGEAGTAGAIFVRETY